MERGLPLQAKRALLCQLAPSYRNASRARKRELLETFVQFTGYHRRYAMWLLNHAGEEPPISKHPRPCSYGPEVQQALVQVWEHANRICAKRLIPFLPTFLDVLERHGHLHLSEECRKQLLRVSAATADRLLRSHRRRGPQGLSTTRAGTLLKQQIPIRTFQQWDQTHPGFLEADVVAHCGGNLEGSYLCTLTLTDIATGWTECVPLLYKSQETVLEAVAYARTLFPFPILGLDTDNGGEFINELLLSYCEQEQLMFTRGRPCLKNDQCLIEQKNGDIVRQAVGHGRLVGMQAYQQLREVYRALRLYVNCFQPSMKLQGKQYEGRRVRRVYDGAKTPLQRLLLSQVVSDSQEQALQQMFLALDPVRLFEQVKGLQHALFAHAASTVPDAEERAGVAPLRRFCVDDCLAGLAVHEALKKGQGVEQHEEAEASPTTQSLLAWPRTRHDPFKEVWELIACRVVAHPERGCGELFRELQRLFPGRYQPSQLRTLQRGVRKIRARLREPRAKQWQQEIIQADMSALLAPRQQEQPTEEIMEQGQTRVFPSTKELSQSQTEEALWLSHRRAEKKASNLPAPVTRTGASCASEAEVQTSQAEPLSCPSLPRSSTRQRRSTLRIEQAVREYLEWHRKDRRRPKTLEWHQTALHLFQKYLRTKCQCECIAQITETHVCGWVSWLRETPTERGTLRSAGTVQSYARSVRAFCQWLMHQRALPRTPFPRRLLPVVDVSFLHLLEPEEWEGLLHACGTVEGKRKVTKQAVARNRALLWVLAETGMRLSELCGLRLQDVDREQGLLRVQGNGSKQRWLPIGQEGLCHLLKYVDDFRLQTAQEGKRRRLGEEALFVSEGGRPLTENGIALLFSRLRKRAGITRKSVNPTVLRDGFAVRYLQAGGDLFTLRELLGQEESIRVKRYLRMRE